MVKAGVFFSNRSQAVRLPKAVSFSEQVKQVDVVVIGRSRLISPAGCSWDSWFAAEGADRVSDDFMISRDQPADQERDQ